MDFKSRLVDYYRFLQHEVQTSESLSHSISSLRNWCMNEMPHPDWPHIWQIDAAIELASAQSWIRNLTCASPAPFMVRAAYLGLGEFADEQGIEFADLYPGFMGKYDPADQSMQWLWCKERHYPKDAYLGSLALRHGGTTCLRPGGIGTTGHICLSVGFASILLKHALDARAWESFCSACPIGVVTGFDGGDFFLLGEMTSSGFSVNTRAWF